uniref:HAT C-terminal dimerisation domain-containing protein n=1 Tax=Octopus bimaculoides TaxID=37653 RepID=A0A0L8GC22_OCTBM
MCCSDFWIEMARSYPDVAKMDLRVLMPFPTIYECEIAFFTPCHQNEVTKST